jgi:hypothetical protein
MSTDPYGWNDTGAKADDASRAMWYGVSAAVLASFGPCLCYVPYFAALPLGIMALVSGSRALRGGGPTDENERAMATAGVLSGATSSALGAMVIVTALLYVAFLFLYFVIIVGAIASGAASDG